MDNDIKELNIPNVCFSLITKGDTRELEFKKQRIERGFDESETWSLTDTISKFIIPRLKEYQIIANDILDRDDNLVSNINKFLRAMELTCKDQGSRIYTKEEESELVEGLELFPKIFMTLWW